ncbi:hypothetical protein HV824_02280 [Myxococcus sp. AM009]|uniref:hypothetical protein n=1 Tax=unclassified Myxococcus TaxID=2648731 RepID=UPI001594E87C|nr:MULTISPECIES: hypothetical protein [unclassified Myxococcus]NVI96951.1 hypothetical protein [Myxococcus sp. AM009]NVJ14019.1 hypothetical protein [Myxococcus sp. AM010]
MPPMTPREDDMKATTRYLVLLSMLVVGCGDSNEAEVDAGTDSLPETLACGDTSCKRATQYCATIVTDVTSHLCLTKEASCKSCDCVNLDTDLTAQTGRQDCTATSRLDVYFSCAYYDDVDYIKTSCTVRAR